MASKPQTTDPAYDNASPDASASRPVYFKSKVLRPNKNFRKRLAPTEIENSSEDGSNSDEDVSPLGADSLAKRRRQNVHNHVSASSKAASADTEVFPVTFQADRKAELTDTNDATKYRDRFDEPATKSPTRAANNVRVTTSIDYASGVCKDYRKSGYCGFGDSCIYLHHRADVKKGSELGRDWEVVEGKHRLGRNVVGCQRFAG